MWSSDVEYVAMLEAMKEIRFLFHLHRDIRIPIKLYIMVMTGIVGAMFIKKNASSGVRPRHIDIGYHLLRMM
jgi:hypothetical protein